MLPVVAPFRTNLNETEFVSKEVNKIQNTTTLSERSKQNRLHYLLQTTNLNHVYSL